MFDDKKPATDNKTPTADILKAAKAAVGPQAITGVTKAVIDVQFGNSSRGGNITLSGDSSPDKPLTYAVQRPTKLFNETEQYRFAQSTIVIRAGDTQLNLHRNDSTDVIIGSSSRRPEDGRTHVIQLEEFHKNTNIDVHSRPGAPRTATSPLIDPVSELTVGKIKIFAEEGRNKDSVYLKMGEKGPSVLILQDGKFTAEPAKLEKQIRDAAEGKVGAPPEKVKEGAFIQ
jgi:hypothetical protein